MGSINVASSSDAYRQLLPTAVDQIAETEPEAVWASVSISPTGVDAGYQNITYQQFANAINGVAWWLEEQLGRGNTTEPLAFFGTDGTDVRYPILLIAAIKARYYVSPGVSAKTCKELADFLRCSSIHPVTVSMHISVSSRPKNVVR